MRSQPQTQALAFERSVLGAAAQPHLHVAPHALLLPKMSASADAQQHRGAQAAAGAAAPQGNGSGAGPLPPAPNSYAAHAHGSGYYSHGHGHAYPYAPAQGHAYPYAQSQSQAHVDPRQYAGGAAPRGLPGPADYFSAPGPAPAAAAAAAKGEGIARSRIVIACQSCRRRKIKCDGEQPACNHCTAHSRECVYSAVTAEENDAERRKRAASRRKREDAASSLSAAVSAMLSGGGGGGGGGQAYGGRPGAPLPPPPPRATVRRARSYTTNTHQGAPAGARRISPPRSRAGRTARRAPSPGALSSSASFPPPVGMQASASGSSSGSGSGLQLHDLPVWTYGASFQLGAVSQPSTPLVPYGLAQQMTAYPYPPAGQQPMQPPRSADGPYDSSASAFAGGLPGIAPSSFDGRRTNMPGYSDAGSSTSGHSPTQGRFQLPPVPVQHAAPHYYGGHAHGSNAYPHAHAHAYSHEERYQDLQTAFGGLRRPSAQDRAVATFLAQAEFTRQQRGTRYPTYPDEDDTQEVVWLPPAIPESSTAATAAAAAAEAEAAAAEPLDAPTRFYLAPSNIASHIAAENAASSGGDADASAGGSGSASSPAGPAGAGAGGLPGAFGVAQQAAADRVSASGPSSLYMYRDSVDMTSNASSAGSVAGLTAAVSEGDFGGLAHAHAQGQGHAHSNSHGGHAHTAQALLAASPADYSASVASSESSPSAASLPPNFRPSLTPAAAPTVEDPNNVDWTRSDNWP